MSDHHPLKHTPISSKSSKRSLEILSESLEHITKTPCHSPEGAPGRCEGAFAATDTCTHRRCGESLVILASEILRSLHDLLSKSRAAQVSFRMTFWDNF